MFSNYEQWYKAIETAANREFSTNAEIDIVMDLALERVGRRVRVPENNMMDEIIITGEITDLPAMCRHVNQVSVINNNGDFTNLRKLNPQQIYKYSEAGFPSAYALRGNRQIQIRAVPTGQTFLIDYYAQPTFNRKGHIDLDAFMESYQSLFLYAGLAELYGTVIKDDKNYLLALRMFEDEAEFANSNARQSRNSGVARA